MYKRVLSIMIVVMLSFGLSAAYGIGTGNEKVSLLQKMKNAYHNFRDRQQQKSQVVRKEAADQPAAPKAELKDKEVTREEMLAELKEDLVDNDEVFDAVPELKADAGQDGGVLYTYAGTALDKLSKEELNKLYGRVRQALVKIRTDRIQQQLEIVKQVSTTNVARGGAAVPSRPPELPQIPRMTPVPSTPPSVPSVPRTPPSPPQVPQRR